MAGVSNNYMNANQEPWPASVKIKGPRNFRSSGCQEEAAHGRTGSKADKDAKDDKAQNPIERPDGTRQRATVIIVVLMNPRRMMWRSLEHAQSRCTRIISVEISSTKRHEQRNLRRWVGQLPTVEWGLTTSCSPPPIVSLPRSPVVPS